MRLLPPPAAPVSKRMESVIAKASRCHSVAGKWINWTLLFVWVGGFRFTNDTRWTIPLTGVKPLFYINYIVGVASRFAGLRGGFTQYPVNDFRSRFLAHTLIG